MQNFAHFANSCTFCTPLSIFYNLCPIFTILRILHLKAFVQLAHPPAFGACFLTWWLPQACQFWAQVSFLRETLPFLSASLQEIKQTDSICKSLVFYSQWYNILQTILYTLIWFESWDWPAKWIVLIGHWSFQPKLGLQGWYQATDRSTSISDIWMLAQLNFAMHQRLTLLQMIQQTFHILHWKNVISDPGIHPKRGCQFGRSQSPKRKYL